MSDDRPAAYYEDGIPIFRASALFGDCEAAIAKALAGQPRRDPPKFMLEKFEQGNIAEPKIINIVHKRDRFKPVDTDTLKLFGTIQPETGQVETHLDLGIAQVRCHPDSIVVKVDDPGLSDSTPPEFQLGKFAVLEVKALGESMFKKWQSQGLDVISTYKGQVAIEMLSTGLPCVYAVGLKNEDGKVLKDNVYLKFYTEPPYTRGQITKKCLRIVRMAKAITESATPPECNGRAYPCPYYTDPGALCNKNTTREQSDLDETDPAKATAIREAASAYHHAHGLELKAKERKTKAKDKLLDLLDSSIELGPFQVDYQPSAKGSVSWKAVAEEIGYDGIDLDKFRGKEKAATIKKVTRTDAQ